MISNSYVSSKAAWEFFRRKDLLAARIRARLFGALGRLSGRSAGQDVLIGPYDRSYFEDGSQILLDQTSTAAPPNTPGDFNSFHYALGVLNPRRYQNPPNRVSRFRLLENAKLRLAQHSRIGPGFYFSIGPNCEVSIGPWTYIGSDFDVYVRVGITIGQQCMISHGVTLMDYDGHSITDGGPMNNNIDVSSENTGAVNFGRANPIVIEDQVWIGAGVKILKGVRIGKGSVVGMSSVVTKDVAPHTVVGGNPAVVVKTNITWKHF